MRTRHVAAAVTATAAALVAAPPAHAAPGEDYFVVDTQFRPGPSDIVDAGGAFEGCTSVTDQDAGAEYLGPNQVLFTGEKLVECADGEVVIHYAAAMKGRNSARTMGTWYVVESTVPGITEGWGTVVGVGRGCEPAPDSAGCILDTFAGDVW